AAPSPLVSPPTLSSLTDVNVTGLSTVPLAVRLAATVPFPMTSIPALRYGTQVANFTTVPACIARLPPGATFVALKQSTPYGMPAGSHVRLPVMLPNVTYRPWIPAPEAAFPVARTSAAALMLAAFPPTGTSKTLLVSRATAVGDTMRTPLVAL